MTTFRGNVEVHEELLHPHYLIFDCIHNGEKWLPNIVKLDVGFIFFKFPFESRFIFSIT